MRPATVGRLAARLAVALLAVPARSVPAGEGRTVARQALGHRRSTRRPGGATMVLLVATLLAGCAVRAPEPTALAPPPEWARPWVERLAVHERERAGRSASLARDLADLEVFLVRRPVHRSGLRAALARYTEALVETARVEGRAAMLGRFRDRARADPRGGGLGEAVVVEARLLARRDRALRQGIQAFVAAYTDPVLPYRVWLDDLKALGREQGRIAGAIDELIVIAGEVEAVARSGEARGRLVALKGSMAGYAGGDRLVGSFLNPRVCTGIGVRLSCY